MPKKKNPETEEISSKTLYDIVVDSCMDIDIGDTIINRQGSFIVKEIHKEEDDEKYARHFKTLVCEKIEK